MMKLRIRIVQAAVAAVLLIWIAAALHADVAHVPSNMWAATGAMSITRAGASATLLPDGLVLVAGGVSNGGVVATAERYRVDGGVFVVTAPMPAPRTSHTATLLDDGRVLVAGGIDANGAALPTTEIYDPVLNVWFPGPTLLVARRGH